VDYVRHVASFAEELRRFLASPCQLCPPGFCRPVLLRSPNLVPVENEIHLPRTAFWGAPDGEMLFSYLNGLGILHEGLPPDLDENLLEGRVHGTPSSVVDYMLSRTDQAEKRANTPWGREGGENMLSLQIGLAMWRRAGALTVPRIDKAC
jgi:hypothetical protein